MMGMFYDANKFNAPLASWNTAKVTDMGYMFSGANKFNAPLASWNTAKVTSMMEMFWNAYDFNQNLCGWKFDNIGITSGMFTDSGCPLTSDPSTSEACFSCN